MTLGGVVGLRGRGRLGCHFSCCLWFLFLSVSGCLGLLGWDWVPLLTSIVVRREVLVLHRPGR